MDEDPKQHDFDQRKDGPSQEPTRNDSTVKEFLQQDSKEQDAHRDGQSIDGQGLRTRFQENKSSSDPHVPRARNIEMRRSFTPGSAAPTSPTRRRSTQITKRDVRPSSEFDRRYDGPFGRPSMTMTRRTSSGMQVPTTQVSTDEAVPDNEPGLQASADTTETALDSLQPAGLVFEPEPPPLNYTLRTRKMSILFWWSMIVFDSVVMPIALYYGLWYGVGPAAAPGMRKLSANTVFSIVTAALGGASILDYFLRFWRLFKHGSTCRVIGARRMYLDWFHWNFTLAWVIIMVELIVGSVQEWPPIRLIAMPLTTMLWVFGTELLIMDYLRWRGLPFPCRLSSIPKGAQVRPGIYTIIEDICAVDGGGGTEFRENLNKRYEASHVFRSMLRRLGLFWSIGSELMALVCTILIFTTGRDASYAIGWSVPFVWAGVWTLCTWWYVNRELKKERIIWVEEAAAKSNA